jgi:hypothetical protein
LCQLDAKDPNSAVVAMDSVLVALAVLVAMAGPHD